MQNHQVQPSVYSDFVNIGFNLYNFTLYFGSIEENSNQLMGKVKMSPETAKALRDALDKNIKTYEDTYGYINTFTEDVKIKEIELRERNMTKAEMDRKQGEELPTTVQEKTIE
ncbi:DUF3467 domain-containing protein [Alkaliphilus sp. B6464]|uniref:DUF3467 domain-containing protein n=1 Tax=Alkaliphilus sp. B6464 TaxID=2731219 RepID=UPI001BAC7C62|nr:DUF3467 domain-containing protein [Alkaliphilus sp. B6464]QUH22058.1 DUF3467 domain-containing protein [Alkaliphilus sp. B6464]